VNLVDIMAKLPENSLMAFGGHAGAGGFSVSHTEVHFLEERLLAVFDGIKDQKENPIDVPIDATITIDDVTPANYAVIEKLAPYGMGNPKPTFKFVDLPVASAKEFGKEKNHLELMFSNSRGWPMKAIAFFKTRESFGRSLSAGERINLTATFEKSTFAGRTELRLRIVDII
jgi:single-stranded-DNA-specific exonuclease